MPPDMTLDLARITRQIATMAAAAPWRDHGAGFDLALRQLTAADPAALKIRIANARTSWLVADLHDSLAACFPCPPLPRAWSVLATDGSSITPDRHSPVHFFVLNIGRVRLTYGPEPGAAIDHAPTLAFEVKDTHVPLPDGVRRVPIDGARLAAHRAVAELNALAGMVASPSATPRVALQDGSLILWPLQAEEEAIQRWALDAYLTASEVFRQVDVPLAAYISSPGSTDVVNALRVDYCPHVPREMVAVECERCPSKAGPDGPACFAIPPITDRWLFERLLQPGERSDLFISSSKIINQYRQRDPDHAIFFFYLHTGREVARVEIPRWVAADRDHLDLVHAAVYDQAVRGQGYPTALQEAHEAAVIHADERQLVERLIEEAMARAGMTMRRSAKDTSKRWRGL
jgi:GNAT superfamily N-acetyltransferase